MSLGKQNLISGSQENQVKCVISGGGGCSDMPDGRILDFGELYPWMYTPGLFLLPYLPTYMCNHCRNYIVECQLECRVFVLSALKIAMIECLQNNLNF